MNLKYISVTNMQCNGQFSNIKERFITTENGAMTIASFTQFLNMSTIVTLMKCTAWQ